MDRRDITTRARNITRKAEKQLLQDNVKYINCILQDSKVRIASTRSRLMSLVTNQTIQQECIKFISKVREDRFNSQRYAGKQVQ